MSVIRFGTDGWRGRIAADFTFENVRIVVQAVSDFLKESHPVEKNLVVGYDRRFLSEEFSKITCEVLAGNGFRVSLFSKPVPTPLVSFAVVHTKSIGGIVLTASHNPPEFHGFKFKESYGASASPETTRRIESFLGRSEVRSAPFEEAYSAGKIRPLNCDKEYLAALRRRVSFSLFRKARLKVLFDSLYGSASDYVPKLFSFGSLRLETLHTQRDILFGGLSPEPIPRNLVDLVRKMKTGSFDVGFALDGDGDRLAVVAPGGKFIPPSKVLSLLLLHFTDGKGLRGKVVKTVSSSLLIDRIAAAAGLEVIETPVGFKHISERMTRDPQFLLGGEESGGMGFRGGLPERDGLLSALYFLEMMASRKKSIVDLLRWVDRKFGPSETDRLDLHYPTEKWGPLCGRLRGEANGFFGDGSSVRLKEFDGLKLVGKESWILFRMSGTEPLLRIYAEAPSVKEVRRLLEKGRALAFREGPS